MILLRMLNDCVISTPRARISPQASVVFSLGVYLIIERGKMIPRPLLASLFWPRSDNIASRRCLRRALWRLRLAGFPLLGSEDQYVLLPKDAAHTDIDTVLNEPDSTLATLDYHLLPWFSPRLSPQLRDWLDDVRFITNNRIVLRLQSAISKAKAHADWQMVIKLSEKVLQLEPDSESARDILRHAQQAVQAREHFIAPIRYQSNHPGQQLVAEHGIGYHATPRTPLVGRSIELQELLTFFDSTKNSIGSIINIWGPKGIGKTKLCEELETITRVDGATVFHSAVEEKGENRLFAQLVQALQNAPGAAGCKPEYASVITRIASQGITETTRLVRDSLLDLIDAVGEEQPVVIIIDNVDSLKGKPQWLLNEIVNWIDRQPVMLIMTSKSQIKEILTPSASVISLPLTELSNSSSKRLAVNYIQTLAKTPAPRSIDSFIAGAAGNPSLIENAIDQWASTGKILKLNIQTSDGSASTRISL